MKTIAENIALTPDQRLAQLKETKGGSWYDGWRPYCLMCDTMGRMIKHEYGFQCCNRNCGNMIGWDGTRLVESPLNRRGL